MSVESNIKQNKSVNNDVLIFRFVTMVGSILMLGAYILIKGQYQEAAINWALEMRLVLIGVFLTLFYFSYKPFFVKKYMSSVLVAIFYLLTVRAIMTAYWGQFIREAIIAVFLMIQLISVLLKDKIHLLIYLAVSSLILSALLISSEYLDFRQRASILFLLFLFALINYGINFFRIKSVEQREQSLKEAENSKRQLEILTAQLSKTNSTLLKRNDELDRFSYIVSHDLKSPLRAINNLSTWIEQDLEGQLDQDTAENMQLMRGRVVRLENLIDGLLNYSHFGKEMPAPIEVNLENLVQHLQDVIENSDKFKIEIATKLPVIEARYDHIYEIFRQLLDNAVKHYNKKEQGILEIGHRYNGQFHDFYIKDNGTGIEEK